MCKVSASASNTFAGNAPVSLFRRTFNSRSCVSRTTEPGTDPSIRFPPSFSVSREDAPPRFEGNAPVKSQSVPSSDFRFENRYSRNALLSLLSSSLKGGNQAVGNDPVSFGLLLNFNSLSWCNESAQTSGKTPVRSLYDTSSFFNCVAHFNPSPGSAPVSSLSLSSSRSKLESKANPVCVSHTSGTRPFNELEGSDTTASHRVDARGYMISEISAPPFVKPSAPATLNATSSERVSNSVGRPCGQSSFTPWLSVSMLMDMTRPVQSHVTIGLLRAISLAAYGLEPWHKESHASSEPLNDATSPQASSHAGALLPLSSTPQWWCRACSACTSRSHAEREETHVAGARAPHTGACHDSVSVATTPLGGMRLEQSASASASATRGARARGE